MNTRNKSSKRESAPNTPKRRNTSRSLKSQPPPAVINVRQSNSSDSDDDPESKHPSPQESPTKRQKQSEEISDKQLFEDRVRHEQQLYDEFGQDGVDEYQRLLRNSEDFGQAHGSVIGDQALGSIAIEPPTASINQAGSRDDTLTTQTTYMDLSLDESHNDRWGNYVPAKENRKNEGLLGLAQESKETEVETQQNQESQQESQEKRPTADWTVADVQPPVYMQQEPLTRPEDPCETAWFDMATDDDHDSAFQFDLRNTRNYMVQVAKRSKLLKRKPANIPERVWRNKSLRQRVAMAAKNIGLNLDEIDQLSDVRNFVDDMKIYKEDKELRESDFQKLQEMARSLRSGTLSEASKKIYERHIGKYNEFMKFYELEAMDKSTLETYIVAMHHVYSGSTMWSVMSCLNYYYKMYHDHDTKIWPSIRQIMKAVTNNHIVKKAAIFEEEDILEIFRQLREIIDAEPKSATEARTRHNALTQYIGIHMFHYGLCRKSDVLRTDKKHVQRKNVKGHEFYQVKVLPEADNVIPADGVQMGAGRMASGTNKRKNLLPLIYNLPDYLTPFMDEYSIKRSTDPRCRDRYLKNASPGMKDTEVYFQNCGPVNIGGWAQTWAKKLGKSNSDDFSSHSWRRTAATCMVDNGGSERQLMVGLGHKNARTCREYIDYSKRGINERAALLDPYKNDRQEEKKGSGPLPLPPSETSTNKTARHLQLTPAQVGTEIAPPTTPTHTLSPATQTKSTRAAPTPAMCVQQQQSPTLQQPFNPYRNQQQMPMGTMTPQQQQMPMGMMNHQGSMTQQMMNNQMMGMMTQQQQMMNNQMMGMMSPQQQMMNNQMGMMSQQQMMNNQMMMSPQQLIMMNQQMMMTMMMNQQGSGNTIHGSNNSIVIHKHYDSDKAKQD